VILIIAVLAIALLIACVGLHVLEQKNKQKDKAIIEGASKWLIENNARVDAQAQATALKQEIADIKEGFKNLIAEDDPQERGNHFRHRVRRKTTAETYRIVFDMDQHGQRVLEDLVNRFKRSPFTPDDQGGERETSRRIGHAEVVDFLINKVNVANSPNYNEALEIAYMEQNDE